MVVNAFGAGENLEILTWVTGRGVTHERDVKRHSVCNCASLVGFSVSLCFLKSASLCNCG